MGKYEDAKIPGKLKEFLQDLYSGKLFTEFHYGPDTSTTSDEPASANEVDTGKGRVKRERRILRYLNLRNWVHQKIDTHCSMTNFKAAHKFIHTFNHTFYFSSFTRSTALDLL